MLHLNEQSCKKQLLSKLPTIETLSTAPEDKTITLVIVAAKSFKSVSDRVLSCRHLMNVVCNWGRKGFRAMPPFLIMIVKVDKMALLTCHGNRSPMIRIRGLQSENEILSEFIFLYTVTKAICIIDKYRIKELSRTIC